MIHIIHGITSIEVAPDGISYLAGSARTRGECSPAHRPATGARVTVEFVRPAPIPSNTAVCLYYDIAENGGLRIIVGIPLLTHMTVRRGRSRRSYHYRMSHWIAAPSIMSLIPTPSLEPDRRPEERINFPVMLRSPH